MQKPTIEWWATRPKCRVLSVEEVDMMQLLGKNLKTLMVVAMSILTCSVQGGAAESQFAELVDSESARIRALAYSGFEKTRDRSRLALSSTAREEAFLDSTTPYLSDSISGQARWIVTFDSVYLDFETSSWSEGLKANQLKKTYNFVIEPETGRLLKIYTDYEGDDIGLAPELASEEMEHYLRGSGLVYTGLVDDPPPVTFYEALQTAVFVQALSVKEILAWLVMCSHHGRPPKPCWIIVGRGVPQVSLPGAPGAYSDSNQERRSGKRFSCEIDAITGEGIGCGGGPRLDVEVR
jgi:hypothetical protein